MFFVPCDTLADLRIQPWKGLRMVAEYLRLFQHTFWNIHPPKPDPQQAINKGFPGIVGGLAKFQMSVLSRGVL